VNPTPAIALQVSHGRLHSPEQLEPEVDTDRTTASGDRGREIAGTRHWEVLAAWAAIGTARGRTLDAGLLEAGLELHDTHHVFLRGERARKDELFRARPGPAREGQAFDVGELTAGYPGGPVAFGPGARRARRAGARCPRCRRAPAWPYGSRAPHSAMLFLHLELR
jgi:hypothetical protein